MSIESHNFNPQDNPEQGQINETKDKPQTDEKIEGEPEKRFESAKDFSKEIRQSERQQAAETIKSHRREYFIKQEEARNKLEELVAQVESKKINAEQVRKTIEETEREIEQSSRNFITRLIDRNKLKQLESKLGIAKISEESITEELAELETAKMDLEKSSQDRSALETARAELNTFYQKTEEAWNQYEENRVAGNVKNIMKDRNAFLVHTFINPTLSPSDENGLMRKELSWRDKLDLLVLEPTLSASAVDKNHDKTFAPVGVLLANGQVERAASGDIGSRSLGLKGRTLRDSYDNPRIGEQIEYALDPANKQGWTEFIVSEPKIAGLFFKVESDGTLSDLTFGSDANMPDIVSFAQERKLPLFVMKEGEFYSITPEEALTLAEPIKTQFTERVGLSTYNRTKIENRKLDLPEGRQITGKDAAELPECMDENQKEAILEKIMTDSPFQLRLIPEAQQIASRAEGRSIYNLYSEEQITGEKQKAVIPRNAAGNVDPLEVSILKTISGPTHLQHYVELDDGTRAIWYQSRKPVSDESRFRAGSLYRQDWLITKQYSLNLGQSYIRTENPPQNVADIVQAVKKEMINAAEWMQKWEKDKTDLYAEQSRNRLKNLVFSLYGMAEEAKNAGDNATVELIQNTVREFMPEEEYQSVINRRVSESGTFKLTREEIIGEK